MADKLNYDKINAIPAPFFARFCGGDTWPVYDIDVETGMVRIDVVGKLQCKHFSDVLELRDDCGESHDPDDFYNES